jgi:hypothetical protein
LRRQRQRGRRKEEGAATTGGMDATTMGKSSEDATGTAATAHEGGADTRRSSDNTNTQSD